MIKANAAGGVVVINGKDNQVGTPGNGNTISGNGQDGLTISGDSTGSKAQANAISLNASNGVKLVNARKVTIGGNGAGQGNQVVNNGGYGIFAQGKNPGTVVVGNQVSGNGQGDTNLASSGGFG